jgi:hypothetical protein
MTEVADDPPLAGVGDAGLQQYLRDGYLTLHPQMPSGFHKQIYGQVDDIFKEEGNPGNNLLPRIPALSQVLSHPEVDGALTGILGPNYLVDAHRHCHDRPPHTEAQHLHMDSWSRRHHRTRWAMAFYYPQATTVEMGPSGVVPGSHYLNRRPEREPVALEGDAGTIVIVHYDIWHLGMANDSDRKRYMLKFLFSRMEESVSSDVGATPFAGEGDPLDPLLRSLWGWHHGVSDPGGAELSRSAAAALAKDLGSENEIEALHAAYALGESGGTDAESNLVDALRSGDETLRVNAGYGLAAMGTRAVTPLIETLSRHDDGVRSAAVDALADMGCPAADAVPALRQILGGEGDAELRRRAAYALGNLGQPAAAAVPDLAAALSDADESVARDASHTLARLAVHAGSVMAELTQALHHPNRYVQASVLKTLERMNSDTARNILVDFLTTARWCPITTKDSLF